MKIKTKMIIGFTGEIVFFVLTGMFLANKHYPYVIISLILAMVIGGYVGKLIEKDAIQRYKEGELK